MKKLFYWATGQKPWCPRYIVISIALIAGFAVNGVAQALTMIQNQSLVPVVLTPQVHEASISFNGFNVAGGTLTGVSLAWDLTLRLNVSIDFCQSTGDCEPPIMDWILRGKTLAFGNNTTLATLDSNSQNYGFSNATDALQSTTISMSLHNSKSFTNFDDFKAAGSIGQVRNFWESQANFAGTPGILFFDNQEFINNSNISLTYTYTLPCNPAVSACGTTPTPTTPTPTPTTLAMLGLGLVVVGFQRRRKTAKLSG